MFLLASLYLTYLTRQISAKALQEILNHLVTGSHSDNYDHAYVTVIKRIEDQAPCHARLAKEVISYGALARRSLTAQELQHVIAVEAGDVELKHDSARFISDVVTACDGLVQITGHDQLDSDQEGNDTVRRCMVHRTAYGYMQRTFKGWFPDGGKRMTKACVTVLSLRVFEKGPCQAEEELDD